jgi:Flp pilus assembly protein TadG
MLKRRKQPLNQQRRQRGLQLVEAAFVMPIMIMLLGGIAEFGRYFHMRSTMLRATMAGAVYMSDKSNTNTEQLAARRMFACGQPTACTAPIPLLYPGVTDSNATVAVNATNATAMLSGIVVEAQTLVVATNNVRYAPVFRLSSMTGSSNTWWNIPIRVQTKMRYFGS